MIRLADLDPMAMHILRCVVVMLMVLVGCGTGEITTTVGMAEDAGGAWSTEVLPILTARCGTCHSGDTPAAGLSVDSWAALFEGSDFGEAVIAYAPDQSLAIRLLEQLPESLPEGYEWRHAMPFDSFKRHHSMPPSEVARLRNWIAHGARNDAGQLPFAGKREQVFVAVQDAGMVAVIDVERRVVSRIFEFDAFGGRAATPHDTIVEPDGSFLYVTLIGAQKLLKIDVQTGDVVGELDVRRINPTFRPGMLAIDRHSERLYMSRSISDMTGGRSIIFVDREKMTGEEVLVPYTRPHPIGLTPDGRYVLSGSLADNMIAAIDTETLDLTSPVRVDGSATPLLHFDVAPDGRTAAITGQLSHRVYIIDINDPQSLTVAHSVAVGEEPWYPAYTPDGSLVIVPNHRSNSLSLVDVERGEVVREIRYDQFAMPHAAVATLDGRYYFVSNSNLTHDEAHSHDAADEPGPASSYQPRFPFDRTGDGVVDNLQTGHVAVIDTHGFDLVRIIELQEFPSGMTIWPNPSTN